MYLARRQPLSPATRERIVAEGKHYGTVARECFDAYQSAGMDLTPSGRYRHLYPDWRDHDDRRRKLWRDAYRQALGN